MKIHVARQPIYDRRLNVYGYELLYRSNDTTNAYDPSRPPDETSSRVIVDSFHGFGIENLVGKKKAFINFTGNLLKQEIATLFPKENLVVEILENVVPDETIIECCRKLNEMEFTIALDDFVLTPDYTPMLELADIIKIDFQQTEPLTCKALIDELRPRGIRFLAEKIETKNEFHLALALGFTYFQGYFLSKPIIVTGDTLRPLPTNYLRLLHIVCQADFDMTSVSDIIRQDIALSYDLLRLINSVSFGFRHKTGNVHHAVVALGMKEARKWICLVVMAGINRENPTELIYASLIRARMMQNLAWITRKNMHEDNMFLTGLFSMIDVIAGRRIEDVIADLPMSEDVHDALLRQTGIYAPYLKLVIHQERGEWDDVIRSCNELELKPEVVQDQYNEATRWSISVFETPTI